MVGQKDELDGDPVRVRRGRRKVHWTFALVGMPLVPVTAIILFSGTAVNVGRVAGVVVLIAATLWLMRILYRGVAWPRYVLAIYPLVYALLFFRTVLTNTSAGWWEMYTTFGLLLVFMGGMLVTDVDVTAFLASQRGVTGGAKTGGAVGEADEPAKPV